MDLVEPPEDNGVFATRAYWDARFAVEEQHDWLYDYDKYAHLLRPQLRTTDRILVLGCGNSTLSARLYQDGYHDVCNVDYSAVVIAKMAQIQRHADLAGMSWLVMDIRDMAFADGAFDVVLDKGTLDALFAETRADPWNPSAVLRERVHRSVAPPLSAVAAVELCIALKSREVSRVLRDQGRFLSISFGQPHFRKRHLLLAAYGWNLTWSPVGDSFHYYVYQMQKGGPGRPLTDVDVAAQVGGSSLVVAVPRTSLPDADLAGDDVDDADTFFGKLANGVEE